MPRAAVGGVMLAACAAYAGSGLGRTLVLAVSSPAADAIANPGGQTPTAPSAAFLRSLVGRTLTGRVTTVVDGDTVDVRLATGQVLRVRLEGIDAPERGQPFYAQARTATRVALFDQVVTLRATDVDRYQRLVARVTAGAHDSSVDLVRAGLACHFTRYSSDPALAAAQADAKSHARGFWAVGGQRPPACAAAALGTRRPSGRSSAPTPVPAGPSATRSARPLASSGETVAGSKNPSGGHRCRTRNILVDRRRDRGLCLCPTGFPPARG